MRASAWLTLELRKDYRGDHSLHITKVRKTRPTNEMAVKVTLDVDDRIIMPKAEVMIEAGMLVLDIEKEEELATTS